MLKIMSSITKTMFFLITLLIYLQANLLDLFPAVADKVQYPKRGKYNIILLINWLKFILCLSVHSDGQQNILKVKGFLQTLY